MIERYDMESGLWHRIHLEEDDKDLLAENGQEFKDAYIEIVVTMSEMVITGEHTRVTQ